MYKYFFLTKKILKSSWILLIFCSLFLLFGISDKALDWNFKQIFIVHAESIDYSDLTEDEQDCLCYEACGNEVGIVV